MQTIAYSIDHVFPATAGGWPRLIIYFIQDVDLFEIFMLEENLPLTKCKRHDGAAQEP